MQTLSHSAFLQALGYAIAHSLWQMALVYMIYVLLNGLIKFTSATKHSIAVIAQLIGFAWFVVTLQFYFVQCSQALKDAVAFNTHSISYTLPDAGNTFQAYLLSFMVNVEKILPYLSTAYLLLLVFLSIKWLGSYKHTQQIRTQGLQKATIDIRIFVSKIAAQLGIKQQVKVYLSNLVSSPLTIGFLKPIILIPLASINQLSTQQLEAVLLHELAHIKRFDYLLNILLSVVEMVLFFNPFAQLLSKKIKRERENSCDDWVLQFQYNPTMYAEALLRIAYLQLSPALAMNAVKSKSDLLPRVKRMIEAKEKRFNYKQQLLALLLVTFLVSSLAWLGPMAVGKNKPLATKLPKQNTQTIVVEPMATKVDNPLFNPVFFLNKPFKKEVARSLEIANQEIEDAQEYTEIATNEMNTLTAPALEIVVENMDGKKMLADVEESLKNINTKINIDTAAIRKGIAIVFGDNNKQWKKVNDDVKKAETDIRKALKEIKHKDLKELLFKAVKLAAYKADESAKKEIHTKIFAKAKLKFDSLTKPINSVPPNYMYGYTMPEEAIGYSFANNNTINFNAKDLGETVTIKLKGNLAFTDSAKKKLELIFENNTKNVKVIIENVEEANPTKKVLKRAAL